MNEIPFIIFYSICILFIFICIYYISVSTNCFKNTIFYTLLGIFITGSVTVSYLLLNKVTENNKNKNKVFIGSNDNIKNIKIHPVLKALNIDIISSELDNEYKESINKNNNLIKENNKNNQELIETQETIKNNIKNILNIDFKDSYFQNMNQYKLDITNPHYYYVISNILIPKYQQIITNELLFKTNTDSQRFRSALTIGTNSLFNNKNIFIPNLITEYKNKKKILNIFNIKAFKDKSTILTVLKDLGAQESLISRVSKDIDNLLKLTKIIDNFNIISKNNIKQIILNKLTNTNSQLDLDILNTNLLNLNNDIDNDIIEYYNIERKKLDINREIEKINEKNKTIEKNYNEQKEKEQSKLQPYLDCYKCYDTIINKVLELKQNFDQSGDFYKQQIIDLKKSINTLSVEKETLTKQFDSNTEKLQKLISTHFELTKDYNKNNDQLKEEKNHYDTLNIKYIQLQTDLDTEQTNNIKLKNKINLINNELNMKNEIIDKLTQDQTTLNNKIKNLKIEITNLKHENESNKIEIKQKQVIQTELEKYKKLHEEALRIPIQQGTEITILQKEISNIKIEKDKNINQLNQQIESNNKIITDLNNKINNLENKINIDDEYSTKIQELHKIIQQKEIEKEYLIKLKETEKEKYEKELIKLNTDKEKFKNYIDNLCILYKKNIEEYNTELLNYENLIQQLYDNVPKLKETYRIDLEFINKHENAEEFVNKIKQYYKNIINSEYKLKNQLNIIENIKNILDSLQYNCKIINDNENINDYNSFIKSQTYLPEIIDDYYNLLPEIVKLKNENDELLKKQNEQFQQYLKLYNQYNPKKIDIEIQNQEQLINSLFINIEQKTNDLNSKQLEIEKLQTENLEKIDEYHNKQAQLNKTITELIIEKETLITKNNDLEKRIENFFKNYNPKIIKLINDLISKNKNITNTILTDIKYRLDEINKNKDENNLLKNNKYQELLINSIEVIQNFYSDISIKNIELQNTINELQNKNIDLEQQIGLNYIVIEDKEKIIMDLKNKLESYNSNNNFKLNDIEILYKNLLNLINQIQNNITIINNNKKIVNNNNTNISNLQNKLNEDISTINILIESSNSKDYNIKSLINNIQTINNNKIIENIEESNSTIITELLTNYNNLIQNIEKLSNENNNNISIILTLRTENEKLQLEITKLNTDFRNKTNNYISNDNIILYTKKLITNIFKNFKQNNINIENIDILNEFKKDINISFEEVINLHNNLLDNLINEYNKIKLELNNKNQNENINTQLIELQKQLIEYKSNNDLLSEQNNLYQSKINTLLSQLNEINTKNKQLLDEKKNTQIELNELNNSIQNKINDSVNAIKLEYNNKIEELKKTEWTVANVIYEKDEALKKEAQKINEITALQNSNKLINDNLQLKINEQAAKIAKLDIILIEIKIEKDNILKELKEIKENTISKNEHEQILNKLKETHKLEISTLQDQIKIKQKLITKNTIKISFLQDSIDKKTKNNTLLESQIIELNRKNTNLITEKDTLIKELQNNIENLTKQNIDNNTFINEIFKDLLIVELDYKNIINDSNIKLENIDLLNNKITELNTLFNNKFILNKDNKNNISKIIKEYKTIIVNILYNNHKLNKENIDLKKDSDQLKIIEQKTIEETKNIKLLNNKILDLLKLNIDIENENLNNFQDYINSFESFIGGSIEEKEKAYNDLNTNLEELIKKYQIIYDINNTLKIQKNTLISEIKLNKESYNTQIQQLETNYNSRIQLLEVSNNEIQQLIIEKEQLTIIKDNQIIKLTTEKEQLTTEKEQLLIRLNILQKEYEQKLNEIIQLKQKIIDLTNEKQILTDENKILFIENKELKIQLQNKDNELQQLILLNQQLEKELQKAKNDLSYGDDIYYFMEKTPPKQQIKNKKFDKFDKYLLNNPRI